MSKYLVKKSFMKGQIIVPSSKSHTLRAILFASLGSGKSIIENPLPSPDTTAMIDACRLFGSTIHLYPTHLEIIGLGGKIEKTEDVIDAGNSGIVLRFCAAIGALASNPVVITGDHSIRHQRPMQQLLNGLENLGVLTASMRQDGYAPVVIQGPIKPGSATMQGEDSQPVSALIIASAFATGPIEINVINPGEKPWISLTLDWLDRLGIPYMNQNFTRYRLEGNAHYKGFRYKVPGDFSSAAFPIAAALITGSELTLKNLDFNDSQGDKELIFLFQKMGAEITIDTLNQSLIVKKSPVLSGLIIDLNDFVDAITIVAVVACFAEGETAIKNAGIARQKECNRIHCIVNELRKMGADITETEDGLLIKKSRLQGAHVYSYNDHRMAMSLSIAALGAETPTTIDSVECIAKTFPSFLEDFIQLGAIIEEVH